MCLFAEPTRWFGAPGECISASMSGLPPPQCNFRIQLAGQALGESALKFNVDKL